jgi:phosphate-selective porin OprO and OprP
MKSSRSTRATAYAVALVAIALAPFAARAQTPPDASSSDEIAALREQIRLLDQKLRVLERNLELKDAVAAAEAKKQPRFNISDGRLEIASADGANSIRLRGLVQADGRFYLDETNPAGTNDSFLLRRARLIFEGKFAERYSYVIQPEFGTGSSVQILDANIHTAIVPEFGVRIGKFKTPVGLEQLQSDPVAFFTERSVVTGLTPNRDVGVQAEGAFFKGGGLAYQLGVFNGVPDGGNTSQATTDFDSDKSVAARLFATPWVNDKESALNGLGFGVAAGQGNYDTTSGRAGQYRTDGQQTFFAYEGSTVADGKGATLSPQAYYYYGPFGVLAEYVSSTIDVRRNAAQPVREIENTGWNLSAGYVLTGEDSTYKGVTPKTVFNPSAGTWGAFEVVARVSQVDIDDDVFVGTAATRLANRNTSASGVTTYGLGVNWYPAKAIRVGLDYFHNEFELDGAASPATGAVVGGDEQTVIGRVQLSF